AVDGFPGDDPAPGIEDPHQRVGGDGLARSAFADDAEPFPLGELEADAVDGVDVAPPRAEGDIEVADREHAYVLRRGSTISRRPSPRRLNVKTASSSQRPGKRAIHHSPEIM